MESSSENERVVGIQWGFFVFGVSNINHPLCSANQIFARIKYESPIPSTKKARDSNDRYADQFGGIWQYAVTQLVTTPDLLRSYVVLCHSQFQDHGCPLPYVKGSRNCEHGLSTTFMCQPCHKKCRDYSYITGIWNSRCFVSWSIPKISRWNTTSSYVKHTARKLTSCYTDAADINQRRAHYKCQTRLLDSKHLRRVEIHRCHRSKVPGLGVKLSITEKWTITAQTATYFTMNCSTKRQFVTNTFCRNTRGYLFGVTTSK